MNTQTAVEELLNRGWTEAEIAKAVGVSQPTINRIKGGVVPAYDTGIALVALANRAKRKRA